MHQSIWLKKNQQEGFIYYMTEETLEETLALRNMIRNQMENQRWFAASGREDFENALKKGFALNCVVKEKIIASVQCLLEDTDYSWDRYDSAEMREKCADYSDTFVHPDYRGNGLQKILEEKMEDLCRKAGKSILLGTVDPDNFYSRKNFEQSGYKEVRVLEKYNGLKRLLMEKKIG